jgi:hypothetical protein
MNPPKPPALPQSQALLMADYILRDSLTGKYSVLGLFFNLNPHGFPYTHQNVWVYCVVSEVYGTVPLTFRLVRSADETVLYEASPIPVTASDPTEAIDVIDRAPEVEFRAPEEYRLEVAAGELFATRRFHVRQAGAAADS